MGSNVTETISFSLPSRGVSILIKVHLLARDAGERGFEQVVQEPAAVDGVHSLTQALMIRTKVTVHIVEAVRHGVDGIDHKAHLTVLNVVVLQALISCRGSKLSFCCAVLQNVLLSVYAR